MDFEEVQFGERFADTGFAHVHFPGVEDTRNLAFGVHARDFVQAELVGGGQCAGHTDETDLEVAVVELFDDQVGKKFVALLAIIGDAAAFFNFPVHIFFSFSFYRFRMRRAVPPITCAKSSELRKSQYFSIHCRDWR